MCLKRRLRCWYTPWGRGRKLCLDPPPPAAADVVVDQLGKFRLKRPHCLHLIFVPRLMTGYWRRAMLRECDEYFDF